MNVTIINGSPPDYDFGLNGVSAIISNTFSELGADVKEICLPLSGVSFYNGARLEAADSVMERIERSDGVIFVNAVSPISAGASMYVLAEHFERRNPLMGKNCMLAVLYRGGGEAMGRYGAIIRYLGGFDSVRLFLDEGHLKNGAEGEVRELIEKHAEDYYRVLRQNRIYILPKERIETGKIASSTISAVSEKSDFSEDMKRDIEEITKFYRAKGL
ncbi:MAG: hypothetical protein LBL35_01785 [Clostridiales bacterium]|jgi:hypothetical protein|nr:hypothetical protein [Clostridiales bacterium]